MDLLNPAQLAWLGLLGPLVLLYVLKRRRTERLVGSTLLWEAALRDLRAERPWRRLVPHLSLLLQTLAILLGALALARPTGAGVSPAGARVAVVIDTSASMAAVEDGRSRLDRAIGVARALARGLPPGGEMMVLSASADPTVVAPLSSDATALERALATLEVSGAGADLEAAVVLASERLRGSPPGSRVVLLTDAAMDGEVSLDGRNVPVEVTRIGARAPNSAIVAVDVRARPEAEAPDRAEVFARVRRFGEDPADAFLTATVEGRGVIASRRVTIEPGAYLAVSMPVDLPPDASGRAPVVRVELRTERGGDALALDDVAVAPSPGARRLPVFVVGATPPELLRVLRADPEVELFVTDLQALASRPDDAPPLDGLPIFVGAVPAQAPPFDSVVVAPTADTVFGVELGPAARQPRIVTWDEEHPLLRFVSFANVHVAQARPVLGAAARALVGGDAGTLVATVARPDGETILVSFDPSRSDWPRDVSFVVFFRNLLERARARRSAGGVAPGGLGEPLRVAAPDGERVRVRTPGGSEREAISRGGVAVVPVPAEPGVHVVSTGGRELFALRQLLDDAESDLAPRAQLTRGGRQATAGTPGEVAPAEAWPWLAAALLFVLLVEALWATRRVAA